jgi:hypothetical protein
MIQSGRRQTGIPTATGLTLILLTLPGRVSGLTDGCFKFATSKKILVVKYFGQTGTVRPVMVMLINNVAVKLKNGKSFFAKELKLKIQ